MSKSNVVVLFLPVYFSVILILQKYVAFVKEIVLTSQVPIKSFLVKSISRSVNVLTLSNIVAVINSR